MGWSSLATTASCEGGGSFSDFINNGFDKAIPEMELYVGDASLWNIAIVRLMVLHQAL